jgi:hypothetical protein
MPTSLEGCYDEIISVHHDVQEIVLRPEGKLVVTSKWIYKIKNSTSGSIEKYKARFVTR